MAERLRTEASAYLRQHADNPVDWWPFTDAAFEEAVRRDVPVFISVGYAACHWCHVMAHESFEDEGIARYLNSHFVPVKVDREERPDVDAVYMAATQAMTGQGGWPMSVFTLPDGRAFFAGTYFPPAPLRGSPSFAQVLEAIVQAWTQRRSDVESSAAQVAASLGQAQQSSAGLFLPLDYDAGGLGLESVLPDAVAALEAQEDTTHGGFGGAPKFPPSSVLAFLLARARTDDPDGTASGLASRALEAMAVSGMHDVVGGGFARYAVDAAWAVPHFEKMLYDNAQLIRLYGRWAVQAESVHARALAKRTASGIATWLQRELTVPGGAFASSLDADTVLDGTRVEGGTYTWTRNQLRSVLGNRADTVLGLFDTEAGRVEGGAFTLHAGRAWSEQEQAVWDDAAPALLAARNRRPQPDRDDKVVACWNGLAIGGLAEAGALLGDAEMLRMADGAARYLLDVHWDGTRLSRVSFGGRAGNHDGRLEDYAAVVDGLQALYAATGDASWYRAAEEILAAALDRFIQPDGRVVDSAELDAPLRSAQANQNSADPFDNATPSGVALLAGALATSSAYSGSSEQRARAEKLLAHVPVVASRAPRAVGWALATVQALAAGPQEVAVVGPAGPERDLLAATAHRSGKAGLALAVGEGNDGDSETEAGVPLLANRTPAHDGGPLAYVCQSMVCRRPVSDPGELEAQLRE
ncbi:DUF255 domain-containing protein [Arthrobacter sp. JZ12]|uniref:thioredoxin domain-containing protein n=1 Tax=Arthrobacter sp. JZ12 TaxID=2654190 RepID=UPI002B464364|nr:thioredoxin domain-containing protein [Arthrobacter sp. JZ12]WRH24370.1 DUF255 domain-containing protein [Arthrobacter sp. JZ12]